MPTQVSERRKGKFNSQNLTDFIFVRSAKSIFPFAQKLVHASARITNLKGLRCINIAAGVADKIRQILPDIHFHTFM